MDDERRGGEEEAGDADEGRESDAAVPLIRVDNGADEPNKRHQLSIINIKQIHGRIYGIFTMFDQTELHKCRPHILKNTIIMAALCNRGAIIFLPCDFYLSIFLSSIYLFFSSPNLSGHRLDVYHTLAHGVALVRI